jgi:hypothetical protein
VDIEFDGEVFEWRGPSPYYFVAVPADLAEELQETVALVSYGWGMVPVGVHLGETAWTTSLWPKDGTYLLPLKDRVRRAENLDEGDTVTVRLTVDLGDGDEAG